MIAMEIDFRIITFPDWRLTVFKRFLSPFLALFLGLTLLFSFQPSARAASPGISLSITSGPPTSLVNVTGSGFGVYETVELSFDSHPISAATTNSSGAFTKKITIPAAALPGVHTIQAVGQESGLSAQAPFLVQTNWPMFGFFSTHAHDNPYENVISATNAASLALDWKYHVGAGAASSSPVVYHGVIYIIIGDALDALDATTGVLLWSYPAGYGSPAVINGIVCFDVGDALDAVNATTGALLWSYPIDAGDEVTSYPTVINDVVYFGTSNGLLYALNVTTGTKLWMFDTGGGSNAAIFSSPAIGSGVVYFGTWVPYDKLYAVNAKTGTLVWTYTTGGFIPSSPAVVDGVIYFLSTDHYLYALNTSGVRLWRYFTLKTGLAASSPAVANGVVYVGAAHTLFAVNAGTGKLSWDYTTGQKITSSPSVANGVVYVGSFDHKFYAWNATSGERLWSFTTEGKIYQSSPAVANGIVYITSGDGYLYAFHLPGSDR